MKRIDYNELRLAVDTAKVSNYQKIQTHGKTHLLILCSKNEGLPAEWFNTSSVVDGVDIYLWRSIPREFKKPVLFHELAEVTYKFGEPYIHNTFEAHCVARSLELRYARDSFDDETFARYIDYQEKLKSKFPCPTRLAQR